jgi:Domain of unknown function (DUF4328)
MTEPIEHGGEWWTQAGDGTWLRWNAAEYRWDPQPGLPPFPVGPPAPPVPAPPPGAMPGSVSVEQAQAEQTQAEQTQAGEAAGAAQTEAVPSPGLREFDPADGRARVAMFFVGVVSAIGLVRGPWLIQRALSEDAILESSPTLAGMTSLFAFAIVASAIAVMVWFKGAYDNAVPLGAAGLRYTPGWAIGGWLIPIGNLFIPKQLADDLWRSSDPALPADAGHHWKFTPVPGVLHLWWIAWLLRWLLTVVGDAMASRAIAQRDFYTYRASAAFVGAGDLSMLVAGALLIKIMWDVTTRQRERARMLREQEEKAPAQWPSGSSPGE